MIDNQTMLRVAAAVHGVDNTADVDVGMELPLDGMQKVFDTLVLMVASKASRSGVDEAAMMMVGRIAMLREPMMAMAEAVETMRASKGREQ